MWGLAGAVGERSTLSVALLVGGLANALSAVGSVTVVAGEVTRIVLGTNQGRMVRTTTVASLGRYLPEGTPTTTRCVSHHDSGEEWRWAYQVGEETRDL